LGTGFLGCPPCDIGLEIEDRDLAAFRRQAKRDGAADALRPARHDRRSAWQSAHVRPPGCAKYNTFVYYT